MWWGGGGVDHPILEYQGIFFYSIHDMDNDLQFFRGDTLLNNDPQS